MESENATTPPQRRRVICGGCDRPTPVCLCHVIPGDPIQTQTKIIILHHPHESRHKLNTTPLLTKSLRCVTIISGRRLLRHHIAGGENSNSPPSPAIYLFPPSDSSPAITLSEFKSRNLLNHQMQSQPLKLIVFDATWKHAKEMVKASEEVLREIGAIRVCLGTGIDESVSGVSIYDSELLLRREPSSGCVSTAEAVARCLSAIEPDGVDVEKEIIRVLREMVRLQSGYLKPIKPRPKLLKKNQQRKKEEQQKD